MVEQNKQDDAWLEHYFQSYQQQIFKPEIRPILQDFRNIAQQTKERGAKMLFAGNGASAAIASHGALDFTKQAEVRSVCFNESSLLTCFANDYGYENWIAQALKHYADPNDVVVLISSSGSSANVVNAAQYAKENDHTVVTFSGFEKDNPLKTAGDVNFWADSRAYNIIECTHMIWLCTVIDMVIGRAEYSVS